MNLDRIIVTIRCFFLGLFGLDHFNREVRTPGGAEAAGDAVLKTGDDRVSVLVRLEDLGRTKPDADAAGLADVTIDDDLLRKILPGIFDCW